MVVVTEDTGVWQTSGQHTDFQGTLGIQVRQIFFNCQVIILLKGTTHSQITVLPSTQSKLNLQFFFFPFPSIRTYLFKEYISIYIYLKVEDSLIFTDHTKFCLLVNIRVKGQLCPSEWISKEVYSGFLKEGCSDCLVSDWIKQTLAFASWQINYSSRSNMPQWTEKSTCMLSKPQCAHVVKFILSLILSSVFIHVCDCPQQVFFSSIIFISWIKSLVGCIEASVLDHREWPDVPTNINLINPK